MKPPLYLVTDLDPLFIRDTQTVPVQHNSTIIPRIARLFAQWNVGVRSIPRTWVSQEAHADTYDIFEQIAIRTLQKLGTIHHRSQIEREIGMTFDPEIWSQVDTIIRTHAQGGISIVPEARDFLDYLKTQSIQVIRVLDTNTQVDRVFQKSWMKDLIPHDPILLTPGKRSLETLLWELKRYNIPISQTVVSLDALGIPPSHAPRDISHTSVTRIQALFKARSNLCPISLKG